MRRPDWIDKLVPYATASKFRASLFVLTSLVPFILLIFTIHILLRSGFAYWQITPLIIFAAGFNVRTFMILHDCAHSSFLKNTTTEVILGHLCGILTLTPFYPWQKSHQIHHASVSNLDKRGTGDVWTMTVREFLEASPIVRLKYRLYRNPFFLFGLAPALLFGIMYRLFPRESRRKDCFSIVLTDLALGGIIILALATIGWQQYILVHLPIFILSTSIGVWLFYIQHQFESVYWAHAENWDIISAAIKGSSFYKLPAFFRWFTGNIGYHNIHHLKSRIPSYNLKKCFDSVPELHEVIPITFTSSLKSLRLRLWDEKNQKMISFKKILD